MASTLPVHASVTITAVPPTMEVISDTVVMPHPPKTLINELAIDTLKAKNNGLDNASAADALELMPYREDVAISSSALAIGKPQELVERMAIENGGLPTIITDAEALKMDSSLKQTQSQQRMVQIQFAAMCYALFVCGWHYGTTGVMLPRIQKVYDLGFAVVSLVFILSCVGSISCGLVNGPMTDRIGFGKVVVLGSLCMNIAFAIQASAPPFPLFAISFAINGFGLAIYESHGSGFVVNMVNNAGTAMGLIYASAGLGALISPLVATQFASARHWSFHYICSFALSAINTIVLTLVFRLKSLDECMRDAGIVPPVHENHGRDIEKLRQMLSIKGVHILAIFVFIYAGLEVTMGGWIVSFLIDVRHAGTSSGYVSAGFFGGIMLGRVILLWVTEKIGERRVLYLYSFMILSLELVVWLMPSVFGDAIAVSFAGLFLGPIIPIVMNVAGRVLPAKILINCIAWISSFAAVGSAAMPFVTGVLASKFGIKSLQPLLIAMIILMVILWMFTPQKRMHMD